MFFLSNLSRGKKILFTLISIFLILLGITFLLFNINNDSTQEKLSTALKIGRLGAMPESNSKLIVDGTDNMFSSTTFIRFEAKKEDIEKFINNSSSLHNIKPELIEGKNFISDIEQDKYPWFNLKYIEKGRKYIIPQDVNGNYGLLYIDDENYIVFIKISHS